MSGDKSVQISIIPEAKYSEWDGLLDTGLGASPYSSSKYLSILCSAAGANFRILGAYISGQLVAGIALYESRTRYGVCAGPRLLLYYHGLVISPNITPSTQVDVVGAIANYISNLGLARVTITNLSPIQDARPFLNAGWTAWPSYTYVMPLSKTEPSVNLFTKNLRRLTRRAEDAGIVVTQDDDFESFFALHNEIHQRKGAPLYFDKNSFKKYISTLLSSGIGRLYNARTSDGRACATQLVIVGSQPLSHTICAGSAKNALNLGVTPFLRARVFDSLATLGYESNDLTDAGLSSVSHFKAHLGAKLVQNINVDRVFSRALKARLAFKQVFGR